MKDDSYFQAKAPLYKTARATVSCAAFKAGEIVAVKYSHTNTSHWFMIDRTENGPLRDTVAYPHTHLTDFVL